MKKNKYRKSPNHKWKYFKIYKVTLPEPTLTGFIKETKIRFIINEFKYLLFDLIPKPEILNYV